MNQTIQIYSQLIRIVRVNFLYGNRCIHKFWNLRYVYVYIKLCAQYKLVEFDANSNRTVNSNHWINEIFNNEMS